MAQGSGEQNCNPPYDGEWHVTGTVTCVGRDIYVRNVTVGTSSTLTLRNVHLTIHALFTYSNERTHHINVPGQNLAVQAGKLYIYDSIIDTSDPHYLPAIGTGGYAVIHIIRSTVQDFYAIGFAQNIADGLIQDSHLIRIRGIVGFAFMAERNPFRLIGNLIEDSGSVNSSVIYTEGDPIIENNTIVGCIGEGIEIRGDAQPTIRQNTITNCQVGIGYGYGNTPQSIHDNDIFSNFNAPCSACPTQDAGFYGDGTNNWWGSNPPDTSRFNGFTYSPWRTSPVHPERLPTAVMASLPATVQRGQLVSFDGSQSQSSQSFGHGFGGYPLTNYQWHFGDGVKATGAQVTHAYSLPGTYVVQLKVIDSKGLSRTTAQSLTVTNQAPTISSLTIQPANPVAGTALTTSASANDPDGDALTYTYAWKQNNVVQGDLTTSSVPGSRIHSFDSWQATVTATDPYGGQATRTATVTIPNGAPILALDLQPANLVPGQDLRAVATATDPDQDPITLTYAWSKNAATQTDLNGVTVPGSRIQTGDTWTATVTARDSHGAQTQATRTTTVGNRAPTITSLQIAPASPTRSSSLSAVVQGSDPDGQAISYTYSWSRNGAQQTDLTGSTVPSTRLAKGDSWRVVVVPSDGHSDGASSEVSVAIGNAPPTVSQATATPATAMVGQNIALHLSAQDMDGDGLSATWSLPGGLQKTGTDVTVSFPTAGTQTIQYAVTDGATPVTGTLSITITAPPANNDSPSAPANPGNTQDASPPPSDNNAPEDTNSNPPPTQDSSSTTQMETTSTQATNQATTTSPETTAPSLPDLKSETGTKHTPLETSAEAGKTANSPPAVAFSLLLLALAARRRPRMVRNRPQAP